MAEPCLLDNDVILKTAAYGLNEVVLDHLTVAGEVPAVLGVARFVVKKRAKFARFLNSDRVASQVGDFLARVAFVEPTDDEIQLAADLEAAARDLSGSLDVGEAQLLAILLTRASPALITGDKRAIEAVAALGVGDIAARVACLEQLFVSLASIRDTEGLRRQVCAEPSADQALSNCFACRSLETTELGQEGLILALQSYVEDLRRSSGNLLMTNDGLSALTA